MINISNNTMGTVNIGSPPVHSSDDSRPSEADRLALAVKAHWEGEWSQRRIQRPAPLPVRWRLAEDLMDHWDNVSCIPIGEKSEPLNLTGRSGRIIEIYRKVESGQLVVLGRAGSGKTIAAVQFLLALLGSRARGGLVPVIFSLGSWNPENTPFTTWLTAQLIRDWSFLAAPSADFPGKTQAAALVEFNRILPVLDAFDEIADRLHREALRKLNEYGRPLLLTSRRDEYAEAAQAARTLLQGAAAIELVDVTWDDVIAYLPRTARREMLEDGTVTTVWDSVLVESQEHLADTGNDALVRALTTPLMVALARTAYSEVADSDPAVLLDVDRFPTPESIEKHLLSNFVPAVYRRSPDNRCRDVDRVQRWLGYLARLGTRDLAWWQIGSAMRMSSRAPLVGTAVGLSTGILQMLVYGLLLWILEPQHLTALEVVTKGVSYGAGGGAAFGLLFVLRGGDLEPSYAEIHVFKRPKVQRSPRELALSFRRGLASGFFGAIILVPVYEIVSRLAFGLVNWLVFEHPVVFATQVEEGLINTVLWVFVAGLSGGVVGGTVFVLETPLDVRSAASPSGLLRTNRKAILGEVVLFGPAFASIMVVGSWIAVKLLRGSFTFTLVIALDWGIFGALAVSLGYVLAMTAWGQWVILARIWLPLTGRLPWSVLEFLNDAHREREVLRQAGAVYQFRHAKLRDHLAQSGQ